MTINTLASVAPITVVTPTVRRSSLRECMTGVASQRYARFADHLIMADDSGVGPCEIRNQLVRRVVTPWVLFLDDDDVLHPDYTEIIADALATASSLERVGVVYTAWKVVGDVLPQPLLDFHPELILAGRNHVPVTACVKTHAFHEVGGFHADDRLEDLGLWQRFIRAGYEFMYVPRIAWTYRRTEDDSRNRRTLAEIAAAGCPTCGR